VNLDGIANVKLSHVGLKLLLFNLVDNVHNCVLWEIVRGCADKEIVGTQNVETMSRKCNPNSLKSYFLCLTAMTMTLLSPILGQPCPLLIS
jgi:hypothetical protein